MPHFLLLTKGTGGDLNPFVSLGQLLKQRQHRVTLVTHGVYGSQVTAAGLDFVALDTPEIFQQMMAELPLSHSPSGLIQYFRRYSVERLVTEFEIIRPHCQTEETVILAHSGLFFLAKSVSESLKLPFIPILLAPFFASNILIQEGMHRFLETEITDYRSRLELSPVEDWGAWLRQGHHYLALWPEWYAPYEANWPQHITLADFLVDSGKKVKPLPPKAQEFLDQYSTPILITHGTSFHLKGDFYVASVEACQRLGYPAMLVTRHRHRILDNLPEHVQWFDALPFEQIMSYMGAVIHHGGIGTSAQALKAGIPQLIPARGFDRPDNAKRLQALGVGEYLPPVQWTTDNIANALLRVLKPEVKQHCQKLGQRMTDFHPQIIPDAIEQIASSWMEPSFSVKSGQSQPLEQNWPSSAQARTDLQQLSHSLSPERLALLSNLIAKRSKRTNNDPIF